LGKRCCQTGPKSIPSSKSKHFLIATVNLILVVKVKLILKGKEIKQIQSY
jgi:hypothetical protein